MAYEIKDIDGSVLFTARDASTVAEALQEAIAARTNLFGANLRGAVLRRTDLGGADLTGADLRGAILTGANLTGAYLRRADLFGADLTGADLRGAILTGADLFGADLRRANLTGAVLRRTDLGGADLRGADLRRANLTGANLSGAYLRRADLFGADLTGARIHAEGGGTHIISRIAARATRSDGYEFFCFATAGGGEVIRAGCRTLTIAEYRQHVAAAYPDTPKADETLAILDYIEARARALGVGQPDAQPQETDHG